jgi:hypothetical protein
MAARHWLLLLGELNHLPTGREAPGVGASCRELWRRKGKKEAKSQPEGRRWHLSSLLDGH